MDRLGKEQKVKIGRKRTESSARNINEMVVVWRLRLNQGDGGVLGIGRLE